MINQSWQTICGWILSWQVFFIIGRRVWLRVLLPSENSNTTGSSSEDGFWLMKRLVSSLLPSLVAFSLFFLSIHNTLCFLKGMKSPFGTGSANNLELRSYQKECVAQAKEKNTVVCLKTGLGKTLIAVKAWLGTWLSCWNVVTFQLTVLALASPDMSVLSPCMV